MRLGGHTSPARPGAQYRGRSNLLRLSIAMRAGGLLLALICGITAMFLGPLQNLEQQMQNGRDTINERSASGQIQIIEIDAKSLQAVGQWPWPRSVHAKLVDKLSMAGASQILFDIDFSARSSVKEDAAFAAALKRASGRVVLPTFRQSASALDNDDIVENLPLDIFREHSFLGSVNVHPGLDGQVDHYPYGVMTQQTPRPSFGAYLGNAKGALGQEFRIDQSINPKTIPRHSAINVLYDRFEPDAFAGKKVIIGATAIEMGDRYATARHGIVPGVVIQALAGETLLMDDIVFNVGSIAPLLLTIALTVFCLIGLAHDRVAKRILLVMIYGALIGFPLIAERYHFAHIEIVPALVFVTVILVAHKIVDLIMALMRSRTIDASTKLPNRTALEREIATKKDTAIVVAIIANYQSVVAALGESGGAEFVSSIAARLEMTSAESDIYRTGRDMLAWIVSSSDIDEVEDRFEAAQALLRTAVTAKGRNMKANVQFGVAIGESQNSTSLIDYAETAARKASDSGLRWAMHDEAYVDAAEHSLSVLIDLDSGLENEELWIAYQPKWEVASETVTSAEALIRWQHPEKGAIRPDRFIPILENENRIAELTLYVLRSVIADLIKWNDMGQKINCSVNVSARLLSDDDFADQAIAMISEADFDPAQLTIEVTESAALDTPEKAIKTLLKFKLLGTLVSVDDYGTGQSTLSYLQRFPADEIKIDQMFVRAMLNSDADRIMVQSTIQLAKSLGLKIVAEGVEDALTLDLLRQSDCDMIQGWHIGKAVPFADFTAQWFDIGDSEMKWAGAV